MGTPVYLKKIGLSFTLILLCLALFIIPHFYNERLTEGFFSIDFYIIWVCGYACWVYYFFNYFLSVNSISKPLLIFCIYLLILYALKSNADAKSITVVITVISFIGIIVFLNSFFIYRESYILIILLLTAFLWQIYLGFSQAFNNGWESLSIKGQLYNSGYFGNYLASMIPFLFSGFIGGKNNKFRRIFFLITFIAVAILLYHTRARAALIGATLGCIIVILFVNKISRSWKVVFAIAGMLIFIFLIIVLFKVKPDSALGRLTIYRVSANIIKDNPITGVGPGRFPAVYNNYQSEYFANNSIPLNIQLLADNTFEAFNSVLQLLSEYGIIGVLFLIWLFYNFFPKHNSVTFTNENSFFRIGCVGCIFSILVCSLFSNPFHVTPILLILAVNLSVIWPVNQKFNSFNANWKKIFKGISIAWALFVSFYIFKKYTGERNWYKAAELAKYNNFQDAEKYYQAAYFSLKRNGDFLFNYGAEAFLAGKYELSIELLENCKKYASANNIYIYLGNSYTATKQFILAEQNYLHAINMVPSHLYPKFKLAKLYKDWNKHDEAIIWRNKILSFPVKIRSEITEELLNDLRKWK